ncbi:AAA family ATPase [Rhizobium sp. BK379]|uniref:AAA family ATPase n=1 Tax=Rhizobium sp. BK379 TaxID=2587059 RepID=UPI001619EAD9|nr:AAA family ATPase [Rhizobium sp. BK379]MBB3440949.1 ABC-type phosphate transport system ATPase subunit [Rhizobium sp. BK379]
MKISYSVQNLRRLTSVPMIELRPITLLLGRNSVGKSTFLRSFPLIRQSVETNASAPILWYGDHVDFGNFKSAVSDNDVDKQITFSFEIDNFTSPVIASNYLKSLKATASRTKEFGKVIARYAVRGAEDATQRHSLTLEIAEIEAKLCLKFDRSNRFVSEVILNDKHFSALTEESGLYIPSDKIFGTPLFFSRKDNLLISGGRVTVFQRLLVKELNSVVDGRIGHARIAKEASRILDKKILNKEALASLQWTDTQAFRNIYASLGRSPDSILAQRLDAICRANHAFILMEALNNALDGYFQGVEYIGPARARSERYYRQQELAVSEISPDGRNLPMFLASLDARKLNELSSWVERAFDYGISVHKEGGHISINLEQNGKSINVLDTGYGVSQVLPVLTQIWWMQQKDRARRAQSTRLDIFRVQTLLIEQPELHLHPAHQALLADVFAEAIADEEAPALSFLIETHSESMINRIGELISTGTVQAEKVQIVIFGDSSDSLTSSDVTLATFDQEGVLQNWPYGFFNY